jgi:hypothetical protein
MRLMVALVPFNVGAVSVDPREPVLTDGLAADHWIDPGIGQAWIYSRTMCWLQHCRAQCDPLSTMSAHASVGCGP